MLAQRCLFSSEDLGGLRLQSVSDSSLCLQKTTGPQESLRGLHDLVTLADRLKVMESI